MQCTVGELRRSARKFLSKKLGLTPTVIGLECDVLLSKVLSSSVSRLSIFTQEAVSEENQEIYWELLNRRAEFEPIAYIVGEKEFYSRNFFCTPSALIPRPDTELLVQRALICSEKLNFQGTILDVGCGTGCVGITLALELKDKGSNQKIILSDISTEALALARRNLELHSLSTEIDLVQASALAPIGQIPNIVVSNPPYICEFQELMPDVAKYEPKIALYAGEDGLDIIRNLLLNWTKSAAINSFLIMEIGDSQHHALESLAHDIGIADFQFYQDLSGTYRVVEFRQ